MTLEDEIKRITPMNGLKIKLGNPRKWFSDNYPALYTYINSIDGYDMFIEKLYSVIHGRKFCRVCGNLMSSNPSFRRKKYCSVDCRKSKKAQAETTRQREKTMLSRYGAKVSTQSEEIRERIKESNMKKYGVEWVISSKQVRDKVKETSLAKYGTEYPAEAEIVKQKVKATCLKRYGTENALTSDFAREKRAKVIKEKYGVDFYSQTEEYKQQVKATNLRRYGVSSYTKTKEFKNKAIAKMLGVPFSNNPKLDYINKLGISCDPTVAESLKLCPGKYGIPPAEFIIAQINGTVTEEMVSKHYSDFYGACADVGIFFNNVSSIESKIRNLLNSLNINYQANNKSIIPPLEIDIWIPEYNVGIEVNGGYWHSNKFKDASYHANKHNMADEANIKMLSFWEHDVIDNFNFVESTIKRELGLLNYIDVTNLSVERINDYTYNIFSSSNNVAEVNLASIEETLTIKSDVDVIGLAAWLKQKLKIEKFYQPRDNFNSNLFQGLTAVDILPDDKEEYSTSGIIVFE